MKVELKRVSFPILVLFFICKSSLGDSFLEQHGQQTSTQLAQPSDERKLHTYKYIVHMYYVLCTMYSVQCTNVHVTRYCASVV